MRNREFSLPSSESDLGGLEHYANGLDLKNLNPKPFNLELKPVLDSWYVENLIKPKTDAEAQEMLKANHEAIIQNNEAIDQFDEHVLEIAEMSREERDALYENWYTSESDKSIIACIETIHKINKADPPTRILEQLADNVQAAVSPFYSFRVVNARDVLKNNNAHFKIMTKKEREATTPDSIDNIASAALETFFMNPDYDASRILEYDDYLYGIMLDCTKRKVILKNGQKSLEKSINPWEFQDRVIESMSGAVLTNDDVLSERKFTEAEIESMQKRSNQMYTDFATGHHFRTDAEKNDYIINQANSQDKANIYSFAYDEKFDEFWKDFENRVKNNNKEVFRYNRKVAEFEMTPWAKKVDLDEIERINNNEEIPYEKKAKEISASFQEAFEVENLDNNNQKQPIELKWFSDEDSSMNKTDEKTLSEKRKTKIIQLNGYYVDEEKTIYLAKQNQPKTRLSPHDISVIAHEMWHAKQFEKVKIEQGEMVSSEDAKQRMYEKNFSAYINYKESYLRYTAQIMEKEARAIGRIIRVLLEKRQKGKRGKMALGDSSEGKLGRY